MANEEKWRRAYDKAKAEADAAARAKQAESDRRLKARLAFKRNPEACGDETKRLAQLPVEDGRESDSGSEGKGSDGEGDYDDDGVLAINTAPHGRDPRLAKRRKRRKQRSKGHSKGSQSGSDTYTSPTASTRSSYTAGSMGTTPTAIGVPTGSAAAKVPRLRLSLVDFGEARMNVRFPALPSGASSVASSSVHSARSGYSLVLSPIADGIAGIKGAPDSARSASDHGERLAVAAVAVAMVCVCLRSGFLADCVDCARVHRPGSARRQQRWKSKHNRTRKRPASASSARSTPQSSTVGKPPKRPSSAGGAAAAAAASIGAVGTVATSDTAGWRTASSAGASSADSAYDLRLPPLVAGR